MDPKLEKKYEESKAEVIGCRGINPRYCRTCRFSRGEPPFEDAPEKAYCMIFSRDEGEAKPPEVYYDGEECEFYEKDKH
jgi:hypothetical protein